ncbi:MAG: dTDP-4-dehydrorhamnose 3,5-epimerase [Hyphomicrobiales bacterium]|nr:dTDP-4-dehydrorhamnose 3,5-epimerase [Hyphomicrobiales bacterium]MBV9137235.1 dTDP-4-dehydrorhamnose 3,5-epimerase [Hyphomicrobiales bacterium]MBV9590064.1 dTDP-4-dehydrorhamnose 3,5-epimerase [Hyphomicrobiales bacterium]MBV9976406.1 dTDP-4-dehydrorhamnose 3,5-epimerase [Hyphomicrobiales bacterium]
MTKLETTSLGIPDVKIIRPIKQGDARGFFSETYNLREYAAAGLELPFVQDNHSLSAQVGTVRGLHYQSPPFAQGKLVRVVRGRIFDVALDIRRSSPSFGQHVTAEISAEAWNQIFVPVGFAHGFVTLEPDTEVVYKVTNYYAREHDHGILWNDPALQIKWPFVEREVMVSEKDRANPRLADAVNLFG